MKTQAWILTAVGFCTIVGASCKKKEEQPAAVQPTGYYGQPGYGQPGYGQQQPGYGTPVPGAYPTATAVATGLPPGPLSPACTQPEGTCGYARCNVQAGRCAFPCNGPQDCIQGSQCIGVGTPVAFCGPTGIPGMAPPAQPTQ
jgi:hypothetical protein